MISIFTKDIFFYQETNKNDVLLIDIINEKQLVITNTCFQKKLNKVWTYTDPCCSKYQLDYILMRKNGEKALQMWKHICIHYFF